MILVPQARIDQTEAACAADPILRATRAHLIKIEAMLNTGGWSVDDGDRPSVFELLRHAVTGQILLSDDRSMPAALTRVHNAGTQGYEHTLAIVATSVDQLRAEGRLPPPGVDAIRQVDPDLMSYGFGLVRETWMDTLDDGPRRRGRSGVFVDRRGWSWLLLREPDSQLVTVVTAPNEQPLYEPGLRRALARMVDAVVAEPVPIPA